MRAYVCVCVDACVMHHFGYHPVISTVFFSGPLGGEISPLSFEFPPQTITNFVCFLDILHIFSTHKSNFPPSLEKTLHKQLPIEVTLRLSYYILTHNTNSYNVTPYKTQHARTTNSTAL